MQTHSTPPRRFNATLLRVIGFSLAFVFAGLALADPPMRVARLAYTAGAVSFSPAGENEWVAGTLNRPLVTGDRLWADDRSRVELQMGSAVVRIDARTQFTLTNLDDRIAQMNVQDGTLNLRVRRLDRGQVVEVDTPNLAFVIRQPGEYRVTVDAAQDSTEVRTRSGRADVYATGANYAVAAGGAYRFFGAGLADYDVLTLPRVDEFDRWSQARDRQYDASISARYVSRDVIGYQDLDQYGSWRSVPEYGNVWTPNRVAADWAPYRDGHWSWVEPWGWTWVDDQPWGFAVSHYGRWTNAGGRWGWIPGPVAARAVYAPALVAFIGGSNFQATTSSGNVGAVGWFPLGPREVYRPAYTVSRNYFTSVNISNTVINNNVIINNYDNRNAPAANTVMYANRTVRGAVVTVPTTAFVQSQPVARAALRLPEATITAAPINTLAAVAPTQNSVLGAAPQRARPPQVREQRIIAQSAPPAAAVGFAIRERALAVNPGKPVDAAALAAMAAPKPAATPARSEPGKPAAPNAAPNTAPNAAPNTAPGPAPRVEIVTPPASGPAAVAPPPKAPSDRRGKGDPMSPRAGPPSTPPPAAVPVAPPATTPAPAQPGTRPPSAGPQEAPKPVTKPAERPRDPMSTQPAQPAPAAAPTPPSAPAAPGRTPPAATPPQAAPAQPGDRKPAPAPQAAPKPGNAPAEPPGKAGAPPAAQPEQPAPVRAQPPARNQQKSPPVVTDANERQPGPPPRGRAEPPEAAKPAPARGAPQAPATAPAPAPAAKPAEPAAPPAPTAPGKSAGDNKKPAVAQDKKDGKPDDEDPSQKDEKEKKRK